MRPFIPASVLLFGIYLMAGMLSASELPLPEETAATNGLARPTKSQLDFQEMAFGLFVHWSPCVYQGTDNDTGKTPLDAINPDRFDANQIVRAAQSCGAGYVIFVAKHVGGYCTWQTKTTDYSIKNSPWRDGKGDMVGELAAACAKAGLRFGVYLCPRDDHASIANGGKAGPRQAEANAYYREQLTELLTNYGPMFEVWFDGGLAAPVNDLFERHAPDAVTFLGRRQSSTRWAGNEYGTTDYPCWSTINGKEADLPAKGAGVPDGNRWVPAECDVSILCPKWFWSPGSDARVLRLDRLMHIYYQSVGRSAVLLLSITPDDHGAVPEVQMKRLAEMGEEIRMRFGKPLKSTSAVMTENTGELLLPLGGEVMLDHVRLREDIRSGERVRQFTVEARTGENTWVMLDTGSHIGVRQIIPFPPIKTTELRLKIKQSAGPPAIAEFAAFHAGRPVPKTALRPTALKLSAAVPAPPAAMAATPSPASLTSPAASPEAQLYQKLFLLIDLSRPGLEGVRKRIEAGDLGAAMLEYRTALAARVCKYPRNGRFGYSLWQPATADELLEGKATTIRYGDFNTKHTVEIGKPGNINFFAALPEYRDVGRDISNLAWINKYAEAYGKTRDPRYLAGWCATWVDFAGHWPEQWSERQKTNPDRIPSLGWIKGPLMIGMRLYAMHAGLVSVLQTASDAGHLDQLDPRALAGIMTRMAAEMGPALPWLKRAGGNQVRSLASAVLEWGILLPEMKDARRWRDEAIPANISTCLPDGSDKEQSLNYFNNGIGPLLNLVRKRIPAEDRTPSLIAHLETLNVSRGRVIPSIVRPDGFVPGTGTDPVWDKYGKAAKLSPPSTAFTSIVLPYGGYAVQRGGWNPDSLYLFMKQTRPSWGHWRAMDGALQLSAYGRNLLVSPMGQIYDKRDSAGGWTTYWGSAVSQNAIVVDGMSSAEKSGDFTKLNPWRWHSSSRFDFMETEVTGPYKGLDFRTDGLAAGERRKSKDWQPAPPVTDVSHHREVHFLREAGCWVVTDRIRSTHPHDFTQSWCVGPEFAENEVEINPSARFVRTTHTTGPNLSLHQFGSVSLRYERHFGVRDDNRILGWVGIMTDREKWMYQPAVAVHANWRGQGEQVLVSLIVPLPGAPERVSAVTDRSGTGISGFDAMLPDGRPVAYRAATGHAELDALGAKADADSLLVIRNADGHLTGVALGVRSFNGQPPAKADFEFDAPGLKQPAKFTPITAPTGFSWVGSGAGLAPGYEAPAN